MDEVARGDVVIIEKRGLAVTEMRPVRPAAKGFPPRHWELLREYPKLKGDSTRFVSEDRDRG